MEEEVISISDILDVLKKHIKLIIASTILCTVISGIISFYFLAPQYETSAKLFIGKEVKKDNSEYYTSDVALYQNLMATYAEVIYTEDLVERALKKSKLDENISASWVLDGLSVNSKDTTQILELTYNSFDPKEAKEVLNAIIDEFMVTAKVLIPNGNIQVIMEPKLPEYPISPNKKMNLVIGFMLGAMIGVGISMLLSFLDKTVKKKDEVEKLLGVPVIGIVHEYNEKKSAKEFEKYRRKNKCSTWKEKQRVSTQNALEQ